ncbi:hypothetical protein E1B28_008107 [Marasmius oreades]|uniref:Uncharacterized protein n=1 Tax=Marasmius oreades TaxID=181124 RepID=A0A9P7RXR9_9AGAR|nr:uncharacterized protein E1B28_008107 [Marasmius oreades]KAG7091706.1 hypothetical protein E1B28_008107 [Marasmius oreades]
MDITNPPTPEHTPILTLGQLLQPDSQQPAAAATVAKRFRTSAERKAELERDPWIDPAKITPKKVRCLGCGNEVKLDMREGSEYYPAPWNKHKKACRYIKEGRRKADETEDGETRKASDAIITDTTVNSNQKGPVLPAGWTRASLEGGGLTLKTTGDLLRELGRQGPMMWGSRPSTPPAS